MVRAKRVISTFVSRPAALAWTEVMVPMGRSGGKELSWVPPVTTIPSAATSVWVTSILPPCSTVGERLPWATPMADVPTTLKPTV